MSLDTLPDSQHQVPAALLTAVHSLYQQLQTHGFSIRIGVPEQPFHNVHATETLKNHCPLVDKVQPLSRAQRPFVTMLLHLPPASHHHSCLCTSCLYSHTSGMLLQTSQVLLFPTMTHSSPIYLGIYFHLFRLDSGAICIWWHFKSHSLKTVSHPNFALASLPTPNCG